MTTPRGNHFKFTATFTDPDGNPAEPVSAIVYVDYTINDRATLDTVAMTATDDPSVWEAIWDSRGVQVSPAQWSAEAQDMNGRFLVVDGTINLSANAANQQGTHGP